MPARKNNPPGFESLTEVPGWDPTEPCNCLACNPGIPMRGVIDEDEVRRMASALGVRMPVEVIAGMLPEYKDEMGVHRYEGGKHSIYVNPLATPEQAQNTICHEMRHAEQAEKMGGPLVMGAMYERCNRIYGYDSNPFEIDAAGAAAGLVKAFRPVVA